MHPGQVVVLHEVLGDELVVGRDLVFGRAGEPPLVEAVAGGPRGQVAELLGQRAPASGSRFTNTSGPSVYAHREQAVVGPVERLHVLHVEDGPLVVRDLRARRNSGVPMHAPSRSYAQLWYGQRMKRLTRQSPGVSEPRAAVAADVVERAQLAVPVAARRRSTGRRPR